MPLFGEDVVAYVDLAIGQDVGVEPAAVDQVLDDPRPGQLLQMQARLAQFDAGALDLADPEPPADQIIEPHPRPATWRRDCAPVKPTSSSASASIKVSAWPG